MYQITRGVGLWYLQAHAHPTVDTHREGRILVCSFPQRLKPHKLPLFAARLKPCPSAKNLPGFQPGPRRSSQAAKSGLSGGLAPLGVCLLGETFGELENPS